MAALSRRTFLALTVAGVAGACSSGEGEEAGPSGNSATSPTSTTSLPVPDLPEAPFTLGIASGDPLPDSVILWTRLAPDPLAGGGMPDQPVPVDWEVASSESFEDIVTSGVAVADPAFAHSVHVDASGLEPDHWYWYRFRVGDHQSTVGRTRTLPEPDASPEQLRFAFASCQNWQDGYYTAYPHLVADGPDLVFFLGDYIYEGGITDTAVRQHNSDEVITLADYRNRWALYKGDAGLQRAHEVCPWVLTWDDHEVDNNYAGDVPELGAPEGDFLERRAAGYQAFYEHTPVRVDPPEGSDLTLYRSLSFGDLASFFVLDTRQYRADQACVVEGLPGDVGEPCDDWDDPAQTILGPEQQDWLVSGLSGSAATWNILANQVIFAPLPLGPYRNTDQWDGYPTSRQAVVDVLASGEVSNPVVITGDIHASGVGEIHEVSDDAGSPVVAVELVGTSISSGGDTIALVEDLVRAVPWVKYVEPHRRGYVLCTLTPDELRADYRYPLTALEPESDIETGASFVVTAGTPGVEQR